MKSSSKAKHSDIHPDTIRRGYELMFTARQMALLYDEQREISSRYVHSTSAGHEAIQVATGLQLTEHDYLSPYYRDDAMLLAIGLRPYELMLQLMAKGEDPFSGGRSYYGHPSLRRTGFPVIPHQSSATGMQAIPATGMAHGLSYLAQQKLKPAGSVVLCSLGDGSVTEGEVAEAFQMAILKKLPIVYLVQDNDWGISATGKEMRSMNAYEYAAGFPGLTRMAVDGTDFIASYQEMQKAFAHVRNGNGPVLVHSRCVLLGHHTSGVRREWYRGDDLDKHQAGDPLPRLRANLSEFSLKEDAVHHLEQQVVETVRKDFQLAADSPDPSPEDFDTHEFAPTTIIEEKGTRSPQGATKLTMVDAALHAVDEILAKHPEALFYGQDVGRRLGGVFREAATLAEKYGDHRVFNTPIQEAYIIGSTAGMSAVGAKAIVEIQFADYIWPGINQLVEELSKSCYLSKGKFPVQSLIRVPIGAYGSGGPYHSGSIESTLATIRGIKVVYPSNAADMKGLLKASFYDPNPVVMLEHKGLYWSKVQGTQDAKTVEPSDDYVIPLGKARVVQTPTGSLNDYPATAVIITYGMGVYWSMEAARMTEAPVEIIDLRTINPIDWETLTDAVRRHHRALIVTEEPLLNSFAESLAGRLAQTCFTSLDAPIMTLGAANLPAVPLNSGLEKMMLPSADKVAEQLRRLLAF